MRALVLATLGLTLGVAMIPQARSQSCVQSQPEKNPVPSASPAAKPGPDSPAETAKSVAGPVSVQTIPALRILCLPMRGSYEQHATAIPRLMAYAGPRGIVRGAPFGLYHNDPQRVAEDSLRWAVCVPVAMEATGEAPYEIQTLPEATAAVSLCTGAYENTSPCYETVRNWIGANGYVIAGSIQEHWLSDPQATEPEKQQARIIVPVAIQLQDDPLVK